MMTPSYITTPPDATILSDGQAIALHRYRQAAEIALLRQIAAAPRWLGAVAREEGLTPDHWADPDTHLIAQALLEPGDWPVVPRLRAARELLRREGLWCADALAITGPMRWGEQSLAALALAATKDRDTVVAMAFAMRALHRLTNGGRA